MSFGNLRRETERERGKMGREYEEGRASEGRREPDVVIMQSLSEEEEDDKTRVVPEAL